MYVLVWGVRAVDAIIQFIPAQGNGSQQNENAGEAPA